jgi:hypothetical protein
MRAGQQRGDVFAYPCMAWHTPGLGEREFEQTDDPYQWVLPTGKLELVHIEGIYIATFQFIGNRWKIIHTD